MSGLIEYEVTWLEMRAPSIEAPPPEPPGVRLIQAHVPPPGYFIYLYRAVGAAHEWTDMLAWSEAELRDYVQDPRMALMTPLFRGVPGGMALLDFREQGVCDLAYFGLGPEYLGEGRGRWLLQSAIALAWDRPIQRMTVNTCTLDHPAAVPLYEKCGFVPVRRERRTRIASA